MPYRAQDISQLAFFLGPYRNLTTLSAATLAMHPSCQVLNHAMERLLGEAELDFIGDPSRATMDRFVNAALGASSGGRRGQFGGSIVHSHAFDETRVAARFAERFGSELTKADATCLVWKDSMRLQLRLMAEPHLFDRVCSAFPEVKFLMPVRNPLDCARSSLETGHVRFLSDTVDVSMRQATFGVLRALAWALEQRDRHPDRVFVFTQWQPPAEAFMALASFLGLAPADHWVEDVQEVFRVRDRGAHSDDDRAFLRSAAATVLGRYPDVSEAIAANC